MSISADSCQATCGTDYATKTLGEMVASHRQTLLKLQDCVEKLVMIKMFE
jgi:hypothetical protein